MNRLAGERSPYLLQHAHNPVQWFPWGEEAFAKARAEAKPIFLSIGYSTCHWCHVMERESFESGDVAAVLNEHFVSIKVDREERPDVDRVYMTFVQATTGSGGWPMSVWLTPDLKPFYGGTYFPPTSRWGRPGFVDILRHIANLWANERGKVMQSAEAVTDELRRLEHTAPVWTVPGTDALDRTLDQFRQSFDSRHGGFGDAPKFPRPSELLFLLREYARRSDQTARDMVLRTLRAMALGGMRDHVGGGFHRYSVDAEWRVPHFEKMLYDQAQLALAYIEAAQVSGDPFYAEVAEDTLLYVLREMTDPQGGFYSAEDADSVPPEAVAPITPDAPGQHAAASTQHPAPDTPEKREGAFYLWRDDEIDALLGDAAAIVKLRFGIEPGGNAPHDPQQEFTGKNLLYVARSVGDIARQTGRPPDQIVDVLNRARVQMFQKRIERPRPHRDDKILTAWNGLTIAAFARMARLFARLDPDARDAAQRYLDAAVRAASFLREHMWNADSRTLLRRYREGQAEISAYAEDYADLAFGLIELFQASGEPMWLEWAIALQRRQDELFWDEENGGWFSTDGRDPTVLLRVKEDYDGAEPTATSVSTLNLLFLSHLVDEPTWADRIERSLRLFGRRLEQTGRAVPMMAAALSTYHAGVQQVVVVHGGHVGQVGQVGQVGRVGQAGEDSGPSTGSGSSRAESTDERCSGAADDIARAVAQRYLPFAIAIDVRPDNQRALAGSLPFVGAMRPVGGRTAVYVCRNFACRQPVTDADALTQELETIG